MQKKYGNQGFVAISVSLDDISDKTLVDEAKNVLSEKKITVRNYLLDEEASVWQEKLKVDGVPVVYVFNREGKTEKKWTENAKPGEESKRAEEIDRLVEELLKQK